MWQCFVLRCILSKRFCAAGSLHFAFLFPFWTQATGGILMSIIHRSLKTPFPVQKGEGLGQWSINFSEAQLKRADVDAFSPTHTHAGRHSYHLSVKVATLPTVSSLPLHLLELSKWGFSQRKALGSCSGLTAPRRDRSEETHKVTQAQTADCFQHLQRKISNMRRWRIKECQAFSAI